MINTLAIYQLSLEGEEETVLVLELEEGEQDIVLDKENDKLVLATYGSTNSGYKITEVNVYDRKDDSFVNVPIKPYAKVTKPGPDGDQFMFIP